MSALADRAGGNAPRRTYKVIAAAVVFSCVLSAQAAKEFEVKAAFLLNFAKFVDWPPSAFAATDSPMTICIMGRDPFGRAIDETVQGETVNGRKVTVQRLTAIPSPQACQVAYFGAVDKEMARTLAALGPRVLTVGEGEAFLRYGGIIAFVLENRRVRFDIDQTAAENASLRLSSKLLSVARSVEHRTGPGG